MKLKALIGLGLLTLFLGLLAIPDTRAALPDLAAGTVAPQFSLAATDGSTVKLSDLAGKTVVLEWLNPDCPFVKRHYQAGTMQKLAAKHAATGVVWYGVSSSHHIDSARLAAWAKEQGLTYPILIDQQGAVGKLYGAKTTPHIFVISPSGLIAYQGAIDDDPSGDSSTPRNYVDEALTGLGQNPQSTLSNTKPYGCSVKYG